MNGCVSFWAVLRAFRASAARRCSTSAEAFGAARLRVNHVQEALLLVRDGGHEAKPQVNGARRDQQAAAWAAAAQQRGCRLQLQPQRCASAVQTGGGWGSWLHSLRQSSASVPHRSGEERGGEDEVEGQRSGAQIVVPSLHPVQRAVASAHHIVAQQIEHG